jgi:hypothetical protein
VDYWGKGVKLPPGVRPPLPVPAGPDGAFRLVVPAGAGHLLFNGPYGRFATTKIAADKLHEDVPPRRAGKNEGPLTYQPNAWRALDLRADAGVQELTVELRRKAGK